MPLRESQRDVDPRTAFGRVVKDDEDVLVCHDSNPSRGYRRTPGLPCSLPIVLCGIHGHEFEHFPDMGTVAIVPLAVEMEEQDLEADGIFHVDGKLDGVGDVTPPAPHGKDLFISRPVLGVDETDYIVTRYALVMSSSPQTYTRLRQ